MNIALDLYMKCLNESSFSDRRDPNIDSREVTSRQVKDKMDKFQSIFLAHYHEKISYDVREPKDNVSKQDFKRLKDQKELPGQSNAYFKATKSAIKYSSRDEGQLIGCFCVDCKTNNLVTVKYANVFSQEKLDSNDIHLLGIDKYNKYRDGFYKNGSFYEYKPFKHAEVQCILYLKSKGLDPRQHDFYLIGLRPNRHYAQSQPCGNCMRVLNAVGWNNIYFIDKSGKLCEVIHNKNNETI